VSAGVEVNLSGNFSVVGVTYLLNITEPTAAVPEKVSSGDNITIVFNFTGGDSEVTSGVTIDNITIGGVGVEILTKPGNREDIALWGCEDAGEINNWTEDSNSPEIGAALDVLECGDPTGYDGPYSAVTGSYVLSGDGDFDPDLAWYNRSLDLSGYTDVNVSFWRNFESTETADAFLVYYWSGSAWTLLHQESDLQIGNGNSKGWSQYNFSIPDSAATADFVLQFRWETSIADGEHISMDDVNFTGVGQEQQVGYVAGVGWQVNVTANQNPE